MSTAHGKMARIGPDLNKKLPRHLRHDDLPVNRFTPRTYQVDLVDAALKRNTIICLSSSTEKLFIALMVIKELAREIRKPISEGGKRTIYVVNSDETAEAQWQVLSRHTNLQTGYYTIDMETETWSRQRWEEEFSSKHALVFTAEVLRDAFSQNCLSIPHINMLIFDDCHLAVGDHAYIKLMQHIEKYSPCKPHILGITASILGSRIPEPSKLKETIRNLETTLTCTAETSMLVISERFDSRPKELVVECLPPEDSNDLVHKLGEIIDSALYFLYECNIAPEEGADPFKKDPRQLGINVLSEIRNILHQLGTWCTSRISEILIPQIEKTEKSESCPINKKFIRYTLTQLRLLVRVFEKNFNPDYDVNELLKYSTAKVVELVHMLQKYKPDLDFMIISSGDMDFSDEDDQSDMSDDDDDSMNLTDSEDDDKNSSSPKLIHIAVKRQNFETDGEIATEDSDARQLCGLVFVDQQYVALALNKFIEEVCSWDENMCFLKSNHIVGQGYRSAPNKTTIGKVYRKQEEVLRKFRMQELNLLIATKVLEQGVDIPKCNLVVRFDPPRDYKSYTLSKGRARARDSDYVILLDEENKKMFSEDLKLFKEIEEVLIGKDKDDDIKDEDVSCYGDLLPPYNPTNNQFTGSKVTLSNSIGLVNRYCAKLPSDAFTHLTPQCNVMTRDTADGVLYVGHLRLPINSPIKEEITGEPMPTKKLAQMAVAHKACEILHKRGELDEQLQPVGKEMFLQEQQEDWDDEDVSSQGRPGTTKRKQYYFKKIADAFMCSHPVENTACYLYMIHMRLTGPITDEQNTRGRSIYAPEETSRCLGIISSKFIPQVPMFPVYTRSGEVTVSIDLCRSDIVITHDQLDKLQKFHHFVFTQVLHLDKDPMECNPKIADVGYLIVPLDPDLGNVADIEWNFVDYVTGVNSYQKKNVFDSKRDIFEFRKEDFEDAVVMPSYRNIDQPQNFYVAEIRYDLSPLSSFPSPELYKTFDNYYTTKYGLVITNTDQPLLDVDHTSARLNLLTPRYMNQKGVALPTSSAETKRARRENLQQKQILIPELCDIHVFPASLWRKAACLPAILYRMNYLLLAEEIRIRISMETGIGVTDLPDEFRFPQLDFGFETSPDKIKRESADKPDVKDNDCQLSNENENDPNQTCVRVPKTENGSSMNSAGCDFTHSQTNSSLSSVSSSFCKCDIPSTSCDMSIDKCDNVSAKCGNASAKSDVVSNNCEVASDKCDIVSDKCDVTSDKCDSSSDSDSGIVSSASDVSIKSEDKISSSETEFDADNKSNPQDFQQKSKSYCSKTQDEIRDLNKLHNKMAAISIDNPVNDNISNIEQRTISDCNKHDMQIYQNQSSDLTNLVNNIPDESQSLANKVKPLCQSSSCITESIPTKTSHHSNTPDTNPPPQPSQEIPSSTDSFNSNIEKGVKPNPESFEHEPRISNHHSSAVFPVGVWNNPKPKPAEIPDEGKNYSLPEISLDTDRDLETFVGPSPCLILQALTMSNANDFFSLERLETIGDSFLKYAITVYLYCTYPGIHEGKLSYLRSKQVSNYNLYRLGQKHGIAECMVSAKFEPYENWLPPCYIINEDRRRGPVPKVLIAGTKNDKMATNFVLDESETSKKGFPIGIFAAETGNDNVSSAQVHNFIQELKEAEEIFEYEKSGESSQRLIPYSLQTQHGIPDKSVADCAEALIGCYLTTCGKKAALMFMSWLGLKVLPKKEKPETLLVKKEGQELSEDEYEDFSCPISPLIKTEENAADKLEALLDGYDELEKSIQYKFRDRSYLLQAFTHASYHYNTVTDCYQRLEFLGDAILDYVITRHLYEDSQKHSPGILTDLRSALVNNNIFAALAVKWDFHKYFKAISPALFQVIEKFVSRQKEREDEIDLDDEFNDNEEEDEDGLEEVEMEIPKALGDIFESVAGAIYLDSGMSLDTVWNVYYGLMKPQIEKYLKCIPKSPVRELLEMEPETAKFEKPERTMDGKIRVTVNVVGKGVFSGIGRNYRIAKSAAAKKALRYMKTMQQQGLI